MDIRAKKHLAQHFLTDTQVIERIVAAIDPHAEEHLVEIGPGLGALTEPLLKSGARLDVIEIDDAMVTHLKKRFVQHALFTLHHRDVLDFDFSGMAESGTIRVVGNLPYNISTPLLMRLLDACHHIHDMHLMVQTEVAERITAIPDTRNYSRLSVAAACFTQSSYLFDIAPSAFSPPPRVSSTLLRLRPCPCPIAPHQRPAFFNLVKRVFSQRRKTLARIFSGTLNDDDFAQLKLCPTARPESLGINDFLSVLELMHFKALAQSSKENYHRHEKSI